MASGGRRPDDVRNRLLAASRQRRVELDHAGERLVVLALADGEVERRRRSSPLARTAVQLVQVFEIAGELGTDLAREIDSGAVPEPHQHAVLDDRLQSQPLAHLVEVDVAALGDRAGEIERAVSFLLPALEAA